MKFGACANIGHWVRSNLDVAECLRLFDGHILEHVANVSSIEILIWTQFTGYVKIGYGHSLDNNITNLKEVMDYKCSCQKNCDNLLFNELFDNAIL